MELETLVVTGEMEILDHLEAQVIIQEIQDNQEQMVMVQVLEVLEIQEI